MEEDEDERQTTGTTRPRQEASSSSGCSSPVRSPSDRWEASPTGDPPQHTWSLWGPTLQRPPAPEARRGHGLHPPQAPERDSAPEAHGTTTDGRRGGPSQQVETTQIDDYENGHELFGGRGGPSQQVETTQIDDYEEGHELFEGTVETGVTDYYLEDDESEAEGLTTDSEQSGEIDHSTRCR